MAQKVRVELVDDIDGTEIADGKGETVSFSYRGTSYEIDLNEKNAKVFDDAIGEYIAYARKATSSSGRGGARSKSGDARQPAYDPKAVREWAGKNGFKAPARGRFSKDLLDAYMAAN